MQCSEYKGVSVLCPSTQKLSTLCHLDQLLLVTHINLSSNELERLPPQFCMLQCLEVGELSQILDGNIN